MSHLCILAGGQVVLPVTNVFKAELITRDHLGSVLDAITPLEVA